MVVVVVGGLLHVMLCKGIFSLCPLQCPEERKLLPCQIKAQLSDNGPPSGGILNRPF